LEPPVNPERFKKQLLEHYNAFNRGPPRPIIGLLMIHDLRRRSWNPKSLDPQTYGEMYERLKGSYQSPKVLQLYAQQCFGSVSALPIDNWIESFLSAPLNFKPKKKTKIISEVFENSQVWGEIERLLWICAQSRKVHSSVCSEILWCIRFGAPKEKRKKPILRRANPLSCQKLF